MSVGIDPPGLNEALQPPLRIAHAVRRREGGTVGVRGGGRQMQRWSVHSPEGAAVNSPGRKPWERAVTVRIKPRRAAVAAGRSGTAALSGLPRWLGPGSQGLRPGLLTAAPSGLTRDHRTGQGM